MLNAFKTLTSGILAKVNKQLITSKADWNQNDSDQLNYIKNRPFYTSDPVEIVIVEETAITLDEDNLATLTYNQPLKVGEEYIVNLDGVEYNAICKEFTRPNGNTIPYIGNDESVGGEDTGEPFSVAIVTDMMIIVYGDVLDHTVSITNINSEVHQLDEKYIPDNCRPMVVNLSSASTYALNKPEFVADKRFKEIYNHIINGGYVYAIIKNVAGGNVIFPLYGYDDEQISFKSVDFDDGGNFSHDFISIHSSNIVECYNVGFNYLYNNIESFNTTDKTLVGAINELDSELDSHNHDDVYETKTDAQAKLDEAKAYTDTKVANAGGSATQTAIQLITWEADD